MGEPDDEAQAFLSEALAALFGAHGLRVMTHGDWIVPENQLPILRARYFPPPRADRIGVVDFYTQLTPQRQIVESFAAVGDTVLDRVRHAFRGYLTNTFHVLLAGLWPQATCEHADQTESEVWQVGGRPWQTTLGNMLTRAYTPGREVLWPVEAVDTLRALLADMELSPEVHWVRMFVFKDRHNPTTVEVLLDNASWTAAEEAIGALAWPDDATYSIRTFFLLQPQG